MADYSYNEIMKMQNDAIRRVNEMQKRAKFVVEEANEEEKIPQKERDPRRARGSLRLIRRSAPPPRRRDNDRREDATLAP